MMGGMNGVSLERYPMVLKSRDVCEILNVNRKTLDRLVEAGTVQPLKIRGMTARRFARAAVEKLVGGGS